MYFYGGVELKAIEISNKKSFFYFGFKNQKESTR